MTRRDELAAEGNAVITLTDSQISDRQELSSGQAPDGTSLFIVSGVAVINLGASAGAGYSGNLKESYRLLVGPKMAGSVRAIATASAAGVTVNNDTQQAVWAVRAIEADLDDESGRVQLLFEAEVRVSTAPANQASVQLNSVAFQVTIQGTPAP